MRVSHTYPLYPRCMPFIPQEAYAQNAAIPSLLTGFDNVQGVGAFRFKRATSVTYGQHAIPPLPTGKSAEKCVFFSALFPVGRGGRQKKMRGSRG